VSRLANAWAALRGAPAAPPVRCSDQRPDRRPAPRGPFRVSGPAGRAGFDAAASNRYNDTQFADATDGYIGDLISSDITVLRKRCRYEHRNNPIARGVVSSWANFIITSTPQVQLQTADPAWNEATAAAFAAWADSPKQCDAAARLSLAGLIRLELRSMAFNGEGFLCHTTAAATRANAPHSLRLKAVDPIRCQSPYAVSPGDYRDGVKVDRNGAAIAYRFLRAHPYDNQTFASALTDADDWSAAQVRHLFLPEEADQYRGFPLLGPAVNQLADLRRYTRAVIAAAEAAANVAGIVHANDSDLAPADVEAMDELAIPRNSLLTMPKGWDITQLRAEQPSGTYAEFRREIIGEIGRVLMEPFIVAYGSSQDSSYASGRLDWQDFLRSVQILQGDFLEPTLLDPVFDAWLPEAILLKQVLPIPGGLLTPPRAWFWQLPQHVDPAKEASAQTARLQNLTTTLEIEWSKVGLNWRDQLEKIAAANAEMQRLNEKHKLAGAYALTPLRPNNAPALPAAATPGAPTEN
jgi:lambda family phage portal protein